MSSAIAGPSDCDVGQASSAGHPEVLYASTGDGAAQDVPVPPAVIDRIVESSDDESEVESDGRQAKQEPPGKKAKLDIPVEAEAKFCTCLLCRSTNQDGRRWWQRVKCRDQDGKEWVEDTGDVCYRCGAVAESKCGEGDFDFILAKATSGRPADHDWRVQFVAETEKLDPMTGKVLAHIELLRHVTKLAKCKVSLYNKAIVIPEDAWNRHHSGDAQKAKIDVVMAASVLGFDLRAVVLDYDDCPKELRKQGIKLKLSYDHETSLRTSLLNPEEHISVAHGQNLWQTMSRKQAQEQFN